MKNLDAIAFLTSVDNKFVKELKKLPKITVGILEDKPLMGWKKEIRTIGKGEYSVRANKMTRKQWGTQTVGSTIASVFRYTPLILAFKKLLNEKGHVLIARVINAAPKGYTNEAVKRAGNSFAALMKQAWVKMSRLRKNNIRRVIEKGFDAYAIGTGQTMESIRARVEKP